MSWGFNGNILLISSNDGNIAFLHFKPGSFGEVVTEKEKQIIIEKKYGSSVLNEYKKNTKVQNVEPQHSNPKTNENNTMIF